MTLVPATLVGGEKIYAHDPKECEGRHCCVHNPSDHHMKEWRQHWREDRKIMERLCPHGIGHPDPDDPAEFRTHGCDGCCRPLNAITIEDTFTIKSAPSANQPDGGHVVVFRTEDIPRTGQKLVQGRQSWPIIGVEVFRCMCFGGGEGDHASHAQNVGVLVPKHLPTPEKGDALIEDEK